jgi:hypothetical protein
MFKTQKNKTAKGNGNLGQAQKWGGIVVVIVW